MFSVGPATPAREDECPSAATPFPPTFPDVCGGGTDGNRASILRYSIEPIIPGKPDLSIVYKEVFAFLYKKAGKQLQASKKGRTEKAGPPTGLWDKDMSRVFPGKDQLDKL
ncbi:MAG: hypothetical protein J5927_02515 [Oscillospiraceae bacterium]|nr:hypothetical protein [Oscillospiraceae bacterium]